MTKYKVGDKKKVEDDNTVKYDDDIFVEDDDYDNDIFVCEKEEVNETELFLSRDFVEKRFNDVFKIR